MSTFAKRRLTPIETALIDLRNSLNYYDIGSDRVRSLSDEMSKLPLIKVMNMEILAAALVLLEEVGDTYEVAFADAEITRRGGKAISREILTPNNFRRSIDNVIERLIPEEKDHPKADPTRKKDDTIILKIKASVLRYIIAVKQYRNDRIEQIMGE